MIRRDFIKKTGLGAAGIGLSGLVMPSVFANGAPNKKIVVAVVGVNNRGHQLSRYFTEMPDCEVGYICDVDERALAKTVDSISKIQDRKPKAEKDFRKALEDKGIDAVVLAMTDFWNVPAGIIACSMGKHVYIEKPLGHNPNEGELMVRAARKYNRIVQMGCQRRSGTGLIQMVADIRSGIIGNVYMAKTWYANARGELHFKENAPIPSWLDYELWQGPVPRRPYKEGLVHYNWHWTWHYGTGEAPANAVHEIDVARWGLGVEFPIRVSSMGGRYTYKDDWETPDTQMITMEFPDNKLIVWEGRSHNKFLVNGADRGSIFYGDNGSIINPGGNSYTVYDKMNNIIKEYDDMTDSKDTTNTASAGVNLDKVHVANFLDCLRNGGSPTCECEIGHRSTVLTHLGNIALRTQQELKIDPKNGHILNNKEAQKLWGREYEKGWEPKI